MIKKSSIEQLKEQIDIVDIISNSLELRKAGANFKACCPFHGEDTPSFVISPTKQIYHCFGCGVGGDAIKFVQEYDKLNFQEAIERIADYTNFTLEYEDNAEKKDYQTIFECINHFYEINLKEEKLQYLLDRGITKESIKTFELGYALKSDMQIQFLKDSFLNLQDAIEVGILATDKDKLYARQTLRLTFPIRSHSNKLIGFGGRTLKNDTNIAKYINSPETKLFNKSRTFYGFNIAKEYIYSKGTIVITEGYLDVIMMHQANIKTAVATMGTALTKEHIPTIKKAKAKVLLCYDGDNAGRNAAYKASILLSQHDVDGGVVIFEDGVDPADMVKDGKIDELYALMKKPINIVKYALKYIVGNYDISNPYEKTKALKDSVDFLKTLNSILANEYKSYLAELLQIEAYHIVLGQTNLKKDEVNIKSEITKADEKFIKTLMEKPDFMDLLFMYVDYEALDNKFFKAIFENEDEEILRPIQIRDDIVIYNEENFRQACKLKQKDYLKNELTKLADSLDSDVFLKIDKIRSRLDSLK
ncbi:DNA primase [Aliarcobacter lanthieri]|uniref:DNA primase n=1 Tax=Aliarcobacter lanthieri TaxID=1355374 RepID=UPI003AAE5DF6